MNLKKLNVIATLALGLALFPAISFAASGNGLTWQKGSHDVALGTDRVTCAGCDPYVGDTSCQEALPLLCINVSGATNPGFAANRWSGGHISLTTPIRGDQLLSPSHADYVCEVAFGDGYRMATHADGSAGWNWNAYGNIDDASRFWLRIDDQDGNCWD